MQATEYLNKPRELDNEVEKCRGKELELWAAITRTTQLSDGMPHVTSDPDKITVNVQKLMEARERTNAAIDRYVDVKQDVIEHIKMLSKKQYDVLYWLYIKKRTKRKPGQKLYFTWSEVAEHLGCTEQNIQKLRTKGIENLQKILDSEGKNEK